MTVRRDFSVAYDYGAGGLWAVIAADDIAQIRERYPELEVVEDWPDWMTQDRYERIRSTDYHDVDGAPAGVLNVILAHRKGMR